MALNIRDNGRSRKRPIIHKFAEGDEAMEPGLGDATGKADAMTPEARGQLVQAAIEALQVAPNEVLQQVVQLLGAGTPGNGKPLGAEMYREFCKVAAFCEARADQIRRSGSTPGALLRAFRASGAKTASEFLGEALLPKQLDRRLTADMAGRPARPTMHRVSSRRKR